MISWRSNKARQREKPPNPQKFLPRFIAGGLVAVLVGIFLLMCHDPLDGLGLLGGLLVIFGGSYCLISCAYYLTVVRCSFPVKLMIVVGVIGFVLCCGGSIAYSHYSKKYVEDQARYLESVKRDAEREASRLKRVTEYSIEMEEYRLGLRRLPPVEPSRSSEGESYATRSYKRLADEHANSMQLSLMAIVKRQLFPPLGDKWNSRSSRPRPCAPTTIRIPGQSGVVVAGRGGRPATTTPPEPSAPSSLASRLNSQPLPPSPAAEVAWLSSLARHGSWARSAPRSRCDAPTGRSPPPSSSGP